MSGMSGMSAKCRAMSGTVGMSYDMPVGVCQGLSGWRGVCPLSGHVGLCRPCRPCRGVGYVGPCRPHVSHVSHVDHVRGVAKVMGHIIISFEYSDSIHTNAHTSQSMALSLAKLQLASSPAARHTLPPCPLSASSPAARQVRHPCERMLCTANSSPELTMCVLAWSVGP